MTRIASVLLKTLFTITAVGGGICIAAVLGAFFFNITLVMFKTGSMGPAIPTGSLAVVQKIPSSQVRIGDIVTVDREGQLPITHRVVSHEQNGNQYALTLRGDANSENDPEPYITSDVRIVLFAVPGLGYPVAALSNPLVLIVTTLGTAGLVTCAFWPHNNRGSNPRKKDTSPT
jgi:signal peptidase